MAETMKAALNPKKKGLYWDKLSAKGSEANPIKTMKRGPMQHREAIKPEAMPKPMGFFLPVDGGSGKFRVRFV
ncbi:hypothetical protein [Candidatus Hecatella orcuttiae]|jgi:hypothetical protein|uniref:hypothetical protein n=1 Tax=Candidatus Hecatella orcuttiae TaxID=1935119 RepID=UPI00286834CA|nr:hypothetical protein [Candidatus Hecatella orcuttiae]